MVPYDNVQGVAVMEGDIVLGPTNELFSRYGLPAAPPPDRYGAVASNRKTHLWPGGVIPYVIKSNARSLRADVEWAAAELSKTEIKVRPRTNETDYVEFQNTEDSCWSRLGRIGGAQEIELGGCGRVSIIHELMHAAGFLHEQSRSDRDAHIEVVWSEIDPDAHSQFETRPGRSQDIGDYDYDSLMHYPRRAFSRRGRDTIIPKRANARIGQREGLSAGDKAAIRFLYGGSSPTPTPPAPTPPTPTTPAPIPQGPVPTPQPLAPALSFAGSYTSTRGDVRCTHSGQYVSCQFPRGALGCFANGLQLDCTWNGSDGSGRAAFRRQINGAVVGSWGLGGSNNDRGAWTLTPARR